MRFDEILVCGRHRRFFWQIMHIWHKRINLCQILYLGVCEWNEYLAIFD
jgi:hypothetical protein